MAISKIQICNLALSRLGNRDSVNNIDAPKTPFERAFAVWYDVCRQFMLKKLMPNFALTRDVVAAIDETPAFGYAYVYQYPKDCLKVLGVGNVQDKQNNYSVEGNKIYTDEVYEDGMELRYVKDETDVTKFSSEFIMALSAELAEKVSLQITQDGDKLTAMNVLKKSDQSEASALNGQENRPIRINRSKFRQARMVDNPENFNKK